MSDIPDPDPIALAAAEYDSAEQAAKAARERLKALVIDALSQDKPKPTVIARRAGWTPAYVRKLARGHDIVADDDYKARTEKARAKIVSEAAETQAESSAEEARKIAYYQAADKSAAELAAGDAQARAKRAAPVKAPPADVITPSARVLQLDSIAARNVFEVICNRAPERVPVFERIAATNPHGVYAAIEHALRSDVLKESDLDN